MTKKIRSGIKSSFYKIQSLPGDCIFLFLRQPGMALLSRLTGLLLLTLLYSCDGDIKETHSQTYSGDLEDLQQEYFYKIEKRDSLRPVIEALGQDSVKNKLLFKLSYHFYKNNDSAEFKYWNKETFKLSEELKDTSRLAEAHWDLANFYNHKEIVDSSFFHYQKASVLYSTQGEEFYAARMLLNIAILQKNIKDYTGSEINTSKAIGIIKPLGEQKQLYIAYNNLGILFNGLGEYDNALEYHTRARESARKLSNPVLEATTLNNLGVVYENDGRYREAIPHYREALEVDSLLQKNPRLFAMLHDNLAYSQFKSRDREDVLPRFTFALRLRDSIRHQAGIVINKLHLAEYYLAQQDTGAARAFSAEAKDLAKTINSHRDLLASLLFLSKIDGSNSESYLREYIQLNDSLQRKERAVRNKFARIQFETDEFIAENQELNEQRKWIIGGSGGVVFMVLLVMVIWRQKARNRKLEQEQQQQKANEDIYNLLLDQEKRIEEGRSHEKERISRELHDGILGNMYGVRFSLSNLNSRFDTASIETREKLLDRLRLIEEEIRFVSRDLQKNSLLEEVGFLKILSHLIEDQQEILGFRPFLDCDDSIEWDKINNRIKMNLYRIIQEAFKNIHEYAAASEASVVFRNEDDLLGLVIMDNGKGFDSEKKVRGIGLKNMRSRVKDLDGQITISSDSFGTSIQIQIPVQND